MRISGIINFCPGGCEKILNFFFNKSRRSTELMGAAEHLIINDTYHNIFPQIIIRIAGRNYEVNLGK